MFISIMVSYNGVASRLLLYNLSSGVEVRQGV